jgi:hypothetical protein
MEGILHDACGYHSAEEEMMGKRLIKHEKFSKKKGERGGMSFSRFNGYSSDQSAKNARDKEAEKIRVSGGTCRCTTTNAYAGGTMMKAYQIINIAKGKR